MNSCLWEHEFVTFILIIYDDFIMIVSLNTIFCQNYK